MGIDVTLLPRTSRIVMACLFCLGFWQLSHSAYIPAKAWLAQELMQRAWRKTESTADTHPPWPWADTWPVAKMTAKGGDIELIVLAGGSGRTLAFGPGHMSSSVLPGEVGNSIIAGHRDTHFQFLQFLKMGEILVFEMSDRQHHLFQVTRIDVVDSRRGSLVLDTDTPVLSLITCYPFSANLAGGPMRYVVTAEIIF